MHEEENGVFILLLKNTNTRTLINIDKTGVIDKLITSIIHHKKQWNDKKSNKYIDFVILSLEERNDKEYERPFIRYRTIIKSELETLDNSIGNWKKKVLDDTYK